MKHEAVSRRPKGSFPIILCVFYILYSDMIYSNVNFFCLLFEVFVGKRQAIELVRIVLTLFEELKVNAIIWDILEYFVCRLPFYSFCYNALNQIKLYKIITQGPIFCSLGILCVCHI